MLEWSRSWVSNVAGEIAMVIAAVMWVTSSARVRRKAFELFFCAHHLYIFYILFYLLHVGAAYALMILPGIFLFAVDRCLRFLQSQNRARLVSARLLVGCATLELTFSKSAELRYYPTSIIFINVPTISKLQWHPFTVTSNSNLEPDKLSLVVKSVGDWSQKLYRQISISSPDRLEISVEGPYGPISSDFLRHDVLVLISGGSGITPFISIIREFIFQTTSNPKFETDQPQILLISAFKNSADLAILDLLLPTDGTVEHFSKLNLRIEAYVTRENNQPISESSTTSTETHDRPVQTKRFNPGRSDSPISGTLGPDSWIWLAGIIASSFATFVVLLAIVTRVYIYPIDDGALEGAYHFSYFVLWDVFLACGSIFAACSAGFFVKKRRSAGVNSVNDREMEAEAATVVGEVESAPSQWISGATKVHFGHRPDLKGILAGFGESDDHVGVMACGPRSLRHEVARICSSARNLHFESISFNW